MVPEKIGLRNETKCQTGKNFLKRNETSLLCFVSKLNKIFCLHKMVPTHFMFQTGLVLAAVH